MDDVRIRKFHSIQFAFPKLRPQENTLKIVFGFAVIF